MTRNFFKDGFTESDAETPRILMGPVITIDRANAILKAELEKAQLFTGVKTSNGHMVFVNGKWHVAEYSARLVRVEEIGK